MKETFQAVDRRFLEGQGTSNPTCGSCALLCLLEGGSLYSAIVGDSRAILVRRGEKGVVTGIPLTIDQNTSHDGECAKVVARSGDPEAIRYNESEVMRGMRREAIKRVGGTLMVTRALGDGYLKDKAYSMWPFNRSLPYITGKPKVSRVEIDIAKDAFVVVASDGIWEHMTNDQVAVEVMRHADCEAEKASSAAVPAKGAKGDKAKGKEKEGKGTKDNIATGLVDEVVRIAARKQCMPVAELRSMRPGGARRGYLDDLTVVIVPLPLIAASKKRAAGGAGGGVEEERSVKRKTG
ncbi:phosphatase 2C-like domain-containing protein [Baffinella frigidus]|nr:phosphatase 2C-like domain-containing protein [Cryptophyta sp. CCMP2293]